MPFKRTSQQIPNYDLNTPELTNAFSDFYFGNRKRGLSTGTSTGKEFADSLAGQYNVPDAFLHDAKLQRQHLKQSDEKFPLTQDTLYSLETIDKIFKANPQLKQFIAEKPPQNIKSDAELMQIALDGAQGMFWYEEWRDMLEAHAKGDPDQEKRLKMMFGVLGHNSPVDLNYGNLLRANSRYQHGFMSDLDTIKNIRSKQILKSYNKAEPPADNLYNATKGELPTAGSTKLTDFVIPLFNQSGGAIDEWMLRLFFGKSGAPSGKEYDLAHARLNHLVQLANRDKGLGGYNQWNINNMQAALWVGYKQRVGDYITATVDVVKQHVPGGEGLAKDLQRQLGTIMAPGSADIITKGYNMLDESGNVRDLPLSQVHGIVRDNYDAINDAADSVSVSNLYKVNPTGNVEQVRELARAMGIQISRDGLLIGDKDKFELLQEHLDHAMGGGIDAEDAGLPSTMGFDKPSTANYYGKLKGPKSFESAKNLHRLLGGNPELGRSLATIYQIQHNKFMVPGPNGKSVTDPMTAYMADAGDATDYLGGFAYNRKKFEPYADQIRLRSVDKSSPYTRLPPMDTFKPTPKLTSLRKDKAKQTELAKTASNNFILDCVIDADALDRSGNLYAADQIFSLISR